MMFSENGDSFYLKMTLNIISSHLFMRNCGFRHLMKISDRLEEPSVAGFPSVTEGKINK